MLDDVRLCFDGDALCFLLGPGCNDDTDQEQQASEPQPVDQGIDIDLNVAPVDETGSQSTSRM